jgi:NAD kinase
MTNKSFLLVEKYTDYEYFLQQKPDATTEQLQFLLKDHQQHQKTKGLLIDFLKSQEVQFKLIRANQIETVSYKDYTSIISLGGDGTFLKAAKKINKQEILGVNTVPKKSVGYLAKATSKNFQEVILKMISGNCQVDLWDRIGVILNGKKLDFCAINEIFVGVSAIYKTSHLSVQTDSGTSKFSGNGLIVSTFQGSSGFYQSSGGAYFEEDNFGFVFLFPYKVKGDVHANMVLGKNSKLQISPNRFHHELVFDGDETTEIALDQDDKLEVFLDPTKKLRVVSVE